MQRKVLLKRKKKNTSEVQRQNPKINQKKKRKLN